jgi:hypothetical protein
MERLTPLHGGAYLRPMAFILTAALSVALPALAAPQAPAAPAAPRDVLYAALHDPPDDVDPGALVAAPGRYVGRAVRTRGQLTAIDAAAGRFALALGKTRVLLTLEPEARALVTARSATWEKTEVTVEGFFYREAGSDPATSPYALRSWLVWPVAETARPAPPRADAARVSLQDLVYGAGRYDGRVVRVRGSYRGSNRHADLPEKTRKGRGDWVIKDGYFAAWIMGKDARGNGWDLSRRTSDTDAVVDVVGIPVTAGGVVRIVAREVDLSTDFVGGALAQPRDAGLQSVSPRVSFAWPIRGETLRRGGHMVLQFSKPLDPQSLEGRVRVRYRGADGAATPDGSAKPVAYEYRQRYRALIVTADPPPPRGSEIVLELLEGIIDVDGRALTPHAMAGDRGETVTEPGVVDAVSFRSGS